MSAAGISQGAQDSAAAAAIRKPTKRAHPGKPDIMNGPLYMQASRSVPLVRRVKRSGDGPLHQLLRWFVNNQIGLAFNLLALLFLAHACLPKARPYTSRYFTLPYYIAETGKYGVGSRDTYVIVFSIVLFTGLRAAVMEHILAPFAKQQGITKRKEITRFSEQAWLLVFYLIFWPIGMYIYYSSPHFLNLNELWTNWPGREISGLMKGYMLAQLAFWFQQILVINIEERRKDHWQMLTHHVITISLIYGSYRYNFTRVGNLILILMDVADIFFPLAKCLKYAGYKKLCDVMFGMFMLSWIVARHFLYAAVCYSAWKQGPEIIGDTCYQGPAGHMKGPYYPPTNQKSGLYLLEPLWSNQGQICWNTKVKWCFLSLLLFLQVLMVVWMTSIIRVAIRVIRGDGADDIRSDDEGEDEDEDEIVYEQAPPLEQEVGVDEIDLKNWERRSGVKRQASTTSVSLPGHSDRKELLGRIGCEKQVD